MVYKCNKCGGPVYLSGGLHSSKSSGVVFREDEDDLDYDTVKDGDIVLCYSCFEKYY